MILDVHRQGLLISAIVRGRASTARRCVEPPHFDRTVGGLVNGHLDRLSFLRFAGLALHQAVPDAKTIWLYREQLKQAGAIEGLFRRFDAVLAAKGFLAMGGQIIDATLIAAPRQNLTIEEKATICEGGQPEGWSRHERAQKGLDARWTLKRGKAKSKSKSEGTQRQAIQIAVPIFGCKSPIGIDRRHGLIRRWTVTDAA